jgi:hypothetical protein
VTNLTTLPTLDNPVHDDDELWALHPTITDADRAAMAEADAAEARRHEAAEAMIAAELDLWADEIPDAEWDRRAEEFEMQVAYESACPPCY